MPGAVIAGPGDHADLPARAPGDPGRRRGDAARFYDAELALRERFGSPPFGRLVKLTVGLPDRDAAEREAGDGGGAPRTCRERDTRVPSSGRRRVHRAPDRWRWNVVLRGDDRQPPRWRARSAVVRRRGPRVAPVTKPSPPARADFGEWVRGCAPPQCRERPAMDDKGEHTNQSNSNGKGSGQRVHARDDVPTRFKCTVHDLAPLPRSVRDGTRRPS